MMVVSLLHFADTLFCCVFAVCTKHFMKCDELLLIKTSSYQSFQKANLKHLLNSTICHLTDVRCGLVNVVQITEHYWTLIKHLGWWMSSYVSVFVCLLLVAFVMPWVAMRETVFCNYSVAYFDFSVCLFVTFHITSTCGFTPVSVWLEAHHVSRSTVPLTVFNFLLLCKMFKQLSDSYYKAISPNMQN